MNKTFLKPLTLLLFFSLITLFVVLQSGYSRSKNDSTSQKKSVQEINKPNSIPGIKDTSDLSRKDSTKNRDSAKPLFSFDKMETKGWMSKSMGIYRMEGSKLDSAKLNQAEIDSLNAATVNKLMGKEKSTKTNDSGK